MKKSKWRDSGCPITSIGTLIEECKLKGVVWNTVIKKPQNWSFTKSQQLVYLINGCLIGRYNIAIENHVVPDYKLNTSIRKPIKFEYDANHDNK